KERSSPPGGEVGKRGTGPGLSNVIRGRFPVPRRRSCPTWRGRRIVSPRDLGQGPVLGAHHPAAPPPRDRTGTVPSTLIRFMTRVPAREMARIMQEVFGAWINPPSYFS